MNIGSNMLELDVFINSSFNQNLAIIVLFNYQKLLCLVYLFGS